MSRKQEHSVGGRQYAKRKKAVEKQEGPAKKSKRIEEKRTTEPAEAMTKCQPRTVPHTMIGSPTMWTVPQPMRPEPDPGTSPEAEPEQDDG